jgi:membrane associated rhomboid family serine protease
MFFPYRARIALYRIPVLTILVCLLCIGIFAAQSGNRQAAVQAATEYCEHEDGRGFLQALRRIAGSADPRTCVALMLTLYHARDEKAELARIAQRAGTAARATDERLASYYEAALLDAYRSFRRGVPADLTTRLSYPPDSWNPMRMLSAAVAHASWGHVIGNLFFFYAFAATVEILLGPILYLAVLVVLALGTHTVYSLAMLQNPQALPTVGLSGVVMGMIALFVFFIPWARISCFLWLIVFYRRFALPAWLLASWYIGWDIYALFTREGSPGVNLVAHLSGAAIGFLLGVIFFRQKRHWAQELVEEKE